MEKRVKDLEGQVIRLKIHHWVLWGALIANIIIDSLQGH